MQAHQQGRACSARLRMLITRRVKHTNNNRACTGCRTLFRQQQTPENLLHRQHRHGDEVVTWQERH